MKVKVVQDKNATGVTDVVQTSQIELLINQVIESLRFYTDDPDTTVHAIYSGGRRVMTQALGLAMTMVGRSQDRLYYVKLTPEDYRKPDFFYPQKENPEHQNVDIQLIKIPIIPLGERYKNLFPSGTSYSDMVNEVVDTIDGARTSVKVEGFSEEADVVASLTGKAEGTTIGGVFDGSMPVFLRNSRKRHNINLPRNQHYLKALDRVEKLGREGVSGVLLYGETGVGKEIFARQYFEAAFSAGKCKNLFQIVDFAAINPDLIDSELFGNVKGAFTGAIRDRKGRLTAADGGVCFIDELNSLQPSGQKRLLRFFETGEIYKVGSDSCTSAEVLVIAALNESPEVLVKDSKMRIDFYHRLRYRVNIPPLRERKEDFLILALTFLYDAAKTLKRNVKEISKDVIYLFKLYRWPGNVRELKNIIYDAVFELPSEATILTLSNLSDHIKNTLEVDQYGIESRVNIYNEFPLLKLDEVQRLHIRNVLQHAGNNVTKASEILGMKRQTLQSRMKRLKIKL
ncbi:MAG: sigma 54-interacting transcriptional regulator [Candidatus Electryonea clarkiae]|nr:sigma 54-interacting transcriptional regulator [Candidatus Electryonea clarkiae]MDP8285950.1 sigma 54-interacting transcriptional regulator [Candidatus Electryonea clarkiae]